MPNDLLPAAAAVMSVDVEDWFQVENLKAVVPRSTWDARERRVESNTMRILELLDEHHAKATFFTLGWIAERHPGLIRQIVAGGHEIASHGYGHELVYTLSHAEFRADVERSKSILENVTGQKVIGYRAPCFSITDWAVGILQDLGFEYDSSVFPTFAHDRYGRLPGIDPGRPIVELRPGFHEVCISCLQVGHRGLPWGGGGYFRLMPLPVWLAGIRRIMASGSPYVFYFHPWEIDPGQPRVEGLSKVSRFRHYLNLGRSQERFGSLLSSFPWTSVQLLLQRWHADSATAVAGR